MVSSYNQQYPDISEHFRTFPKNVRTISSNIKFLEIYNLFKRFVLVKKLKVKADNLYSSYLSESIYYMFKF